MWVPLVRILLWIKIWIMFDLNIKRNVKNGLNFEIQYLLICKSDENILYMKIDQKYIANKNTLPVY